MTCPQCRTGAYCSQSCFQNDWSNHETGFLHKQISLDGHFDNYNLKNSRKRIDFMEEQIEKNKTHYVEVKFTSKPIRSIQIPVYFFPTKKVDQWINIERTVVLTLLIQLGQIETTSRDKINRMVETRLSQKLKYATIKMNIGYSHQTHMDIIDYLIAPYGLRQITGERSFHLALFFNKARLLSHLNSFLFEQTVFYETAIEFHQTPDHLRSSLLRSIVFVFRASMEYFDELNSFTIEKKKIPQPDLNANPQPSITASFIQFKSSITQTYFILLKKFEGPLFGHKDFIMELCKDRYLKVFNYAGFPSTKRATPSWTHPRLRGLKPDDHLNILIKRSEKLVGDLRRGVTGTKFLNFKLENKTTGTGTKFAVHKELLIYKSNMFYTLFVGMESGFGIEGDLELDLDDNELNSLISWVYGVIDRLPLKGTVKILKYAMMYFEDDLQLFIKQRIRDSSNIEKRDFLKNHAYLLQNIPDSYYPLFVVKKEDLMHIIFGFPGDPEPEPHPQNPFDFGFQPEPEPEVEIDEDTIKKMIKESVSKRKKL